MSAGRTRKRRRGGDALLIVDLQKAFPVPPRLVKRIRGSAATASRRIFTRFVNPRGSLFQRLLKLDACAPRSEDTELWLTPENDDVVLTKETYALTATDIRRLKRLGLKRITVCGIDTDACVLAVMFSLFDAGIDCRVDPKLCWSSTSTAMHRAALKIIAKQFPPLEQ